MAAHAGMGERPGACCFFSSRRRHTRCLSAWSSDVCSSDLSKRAPGEHQIYRHEGKNRLRRCRADGSEYGAPARRLRLTDNGRGRPPTAAAADVIFTVVTDDSAQLSVFAVHGDSLLVRARGKVFVNCATVTPKTHVEVGRRAKRWGAMALEGCMASSISQARQGTLYLMCAGERRCFERVRPILERLSTALRFVGRF